MDEGIEKRIAAWDDEEWSLTRYSTPGRVKVFLSDLIAAYREAMKGHRRLRRERNWALAMEHVKNTAIDEMRTENERLRAERDEALNRIDRCDHARATECPWEREGGQLKAENERLRATHEAELGVCHEHCDDVKRLRAERDGWKNYNSATLEAWNVRVAAMERTAGEALRSLEGENEHLSVTNECLWLAMDAARERQNRDKAEIERLKDIRDMWAFYLDRTFGISAEVLK